MPRIPRCILPVSFLAILVGCGPRVGDVAGRVTFKGTPLNHGNVRIMPPTGLSVDSTIAADGTYRVKDVPIGPGKVIVTCMDESMGDTLKAIRGKKVDPQQKGRGPAAITVNPAAPVGSFSLIPEFYGDFENSGLTLDVKSGHNAYDIILTGDSPKPFKLK